jgi:two-component system OmpR family sensor kinase
MASFRNSLAVRMALGALLLFFAAGAASVLSLRTILYRQLDGTLLHLAEVEAKAGAATSGSEFQFHEGVLLAAREGPATELTRYAQLWSLERRPLIRTRNLPADLPLPDAKFSSDRGSEVAWATHMWRGRRIRSVVYPLRLLGAAHEIHLLQVAAPTQPIERTMAQFGLLVLALAVLGTAGAYLVGFQLAGVALRPTEEITQQAEAIEAGTLSERITAHADVQEFGRLVTVLNGMLTRLDRAFQVQRRFTADASHDLRAPLNVLRGEIEVALRRDRDPQYYQETLRRCRDEVLRMSRLAADLLLLARSDAKMPLEHQAEVDLYELSNRIVRRYTLLAAERNQRLVVEGESALVMGDEGMLERALGNLIDNAVKYSPAGGTIKARVSADGEASVTVRDDGQGVPDEHLPHLFNRFFRGDAARPRTDSHGLGLAIALAAAQAHGGRLEFLGNAPGAVFRLTLPKCSAAAHDHPVWT